MTRARARLTLIYGGLFLVVILVLPRGVIPSTAALYRSWRSRRAPAAAP